MAALRAAAVNPVHAYLFRGPAGNGGLAAAHGFAAALLCPDGGCGECATCRAALAGTDPDLHVVRRSGASVSQGDDPPDRRRWPSAARCAAAAPGDRGPRRAPRPGPRPGPAQDARGAARGDRLRAAGRRYHTRPGDHRQPLRRDPVPAGAPGGRGALARRRRGCRRTWPPWWRTAAGAIPKRARRDGRRPRRRGPGRAVGVGARRADGLGRDGRRADPAACSSRPTVPWSRCASRTPGRSSR